MTWQIAIVLDEEHTALIREMPVWALETVQRRRQADEIRRSVGGFRGLEPGLTLFQAGGAVGPLEILRNIVGTVLEHHSGATYLDLIGVSTSRQLGELMLDLEFEAAGQSQDGLVFRKPISKIPNVPELVMDSSEWSTLDDVFGSFFQAVGAPDWHGRNFDALNDSIVGGGSTDRSAVHSGNCQSDWQGARHVRTRVHRFYPRD